MDEKDRLRATKLIEKSVRGSNPEGKDEAFLMELYRKNPEEYGTLHRSIKAGITEQIRQGF